MRQPIHTVYGGAHLFRAETAAKLGALARAAFAEVAPDAASLARAFELPEGLASKLFPRVVAKLAAEPVEDFRIDFEDGFGPRPPEEEDEHAVRCAAELARGHERAALPPFIGIRVKSFAPETRDRAARTLELSLTTLVEACRGALPSGFVVTIPKVGTEGEVADACDHCDALERRLALASGALRLELMVETPRAIIGADGRFALPGLVAAARGRCRGAHFGSYDYTASLGVAAAHQSMTHPACDFARHVMQVSLAGSGVQLSDGATNVLPVAPHRGSELSLAQQEENRTSILAAHRLHFANVTDSLVRGLDQGWDLHPAQIVSRVVAVQAFFLRSFEASAERLRTFVDRAARASLSGGVFDDAATGQGLLAFFLRALASGAVTEEEVAAGTGLLREELALRSFPRILAARS